MKRKPWYINPAKAMKAFRISFAKDDLWEGLWEPAPPTKWKPWCKIKKHWYLAPFARRKKTYNIEAALQAARRNKGA